MDENKEILENNDKLAETEQCDSSNFEREIVELNDKYLRAMAELENTRRRAAIDIESVARSRAMSIAEQFLPLIDAIDAAVKLSPEDQGIKTLAKAAENTLVKLGIVKIETVGQKLNPVFHNAIQMVEPETPDKSGLVATELQTGYMFGDAVLRSAMVVVAK